MAITIEPKVGVRVQNTNGHTMEIIAIDRAGPSSSVLVAMNTISGDVEFFSMAGVPDTIIHAALVLTLPEVPTNTHNSSITDLVLGKHYIRANGDEVYVDSKESDTHYRIKKHGQLIDLGYTVWKSGMRNNTGTDAWDLIDPVDNPSPFNKTAWVQMDFSAGNPEDTSLWTPPGVRVKLQAVDAGKRLMGVYMREVVGNQDYELKETSK